MIFWRVPEHSWKLARSPSFSFPPFFFDLFFLSVLLISTAENSSRWFFLEVQSRVLGTNVRMQRTLPQRNSIINIFSLFGLWNSPLN
jgi:hypothetical protein